MLVRALSPWSSHWLRSLDEIGHPEAVSHFDWYLPSLFFAVNGLDWFSIFQHGRSDMLLAQTPTSINDSPFGLFFTH